MIRTFRRDLLKKPPFTCKTEKGNHFRFEQHNSPGKTFVFVNRIYHLKDQAETMVAEYFTTPAHDKDPAKVIMELDGRFSP